MSYVKYGIRPEFVERVKLKLKNPAVKDRIKLLVNGITKYDLADRAKVKKLVRNGAGILQEKLTDTQEEQLVQFVLSLKIDPNNTFHLIKLWGMFR
ncbi:MULTISPECIES: stage VI sporulation protein F [unclassified Paenibacillus]|uniref:stage VI sporulation protein F n=1 Tax=unclassified Paenibacillus TaxID=185978 RepID=UPI000953B736|nr:MULTISPECIES: stage VI sporulation protein F [unclassified Paenibacillus]ASS65817.1 serine/threonine protein kinase [Paenibacillus sp. RUD330]SIQ22618.1 Stage VI sporulation protein F [Paenibacillus sp. RU4X]SIQ44297.1 Stage VI sporulation protein F [Paenibacillus sp. RU4T]